MIFNHDDALAAIENGTTDWETLTRNVGRNDLPWILADVAWSYSADELAGPLMEAWVMCEIPEKTLDRDTWQSMFKEVGYRHNARPAHRPVNPLTLWRGGPTWDRMSWTADRAQAEWFRDRSKGHIWTASVPVHALLARYDGMRTGDGTGCGETEYVVDPALLQLRDCPT